MKKIFLIKISLIILLVGCKTLNTDSENNAKEFISAIKLEASDPTSYANTITEKEFEKLLTDFASDDMEGRETGESGQKKAAAYLKSYYQNLNIPSPATIDYFQYIPKEFFNGSIKKSENVIAFLEGTEYPDELIVISAHYDHLGINANGGIYNGADDNGSGTTSILQIAEAFAKAKKEGAGPKRSILFLHFTGEEKGLYGSRYYTENPLFPLKNTVCDLNIDMIGRIDDEHSNAPNYIYIIGSDRLSNELHLINEAINNKYTLFNLDYKYNKKSDPNRFYYRSDHYNFAKNDIPIIFYFNGVHDDYHKITDEVDKINYDLLTKRSKLIFYTAWELANRKNRILLNADY
ncbi:M28 family metallopeptidase [Aquimarina agarivorans]|uniref:M28 family metallopeptidase n=1 Tax=Aquimarina agarivorans TaxID=980584 RepID=UPI000248E7AA|nr:M28 family metallopeptidase [Aquimarina agarivorans]